MGRAAIRTIQASGVAVLLGFLTGCSVDSVIWGPEGAEVIEAAESLIDAAEAGDAGELSCDSVDVDFGDPSDWRGLSAGEPGRFDADHWVQQAALEPAWSINLELGASATSGRVFPGDVFFRDTEDGLCVVGIAWATVAVSG